MTGCWVSPVEHDRTRPVVKSRVWSLTGNDRTLEVQHPVTFAAASGRPMTIEIGRTVFEERDTWHASRDRTLRSSIWSI